MVCVGSGSVCIGYGLRARTKSPRVFYFHETGGRFLILPLSSLVAGGHLSCSESLPLSCLSISLTFFLFLCSTTISCSLTLFLSLCSTTKNWPLPSLLFLLLSSLSFSSCIPPYLSLSLLCLSYCRCRYNHGHNLAILANKEEEFLRSHSAYHSPCDQSCLENYISYDFCSFE